MYGKDVLRVFTFSLMLMGGSVLIGAGCDGGGAPPDQGTKVVWSQKTDKPNLGLAQPVMDGDSVYAVTGYRVKSYHVETGDLGWVTRVSDPDDLLSGRELIEDRSTLFINDNDEVTAISKADGRIRWQTEVLDFRGVKRVRMAETATHLFLPGYDKVVRLRKEDGTVDLRIPIDRKEPGEVTQVAYGPRAHDGVLYVPTGYARDSLSYTEGNVFAFDAETGAYIWGYEAPNRYVPYGNRDSARADGAVFGLGLSDNRVVFPSGQSIVSLDAATGEEMWESLYPEDGFSYDAVVSGDTVFVGSLGKVVYAIDLETGEEYWSKELKASIMDVFSIRDGRIYFVAHAGGRIWVLDRESGSVVWSGLPPGHAGNPRIRVYLTPLAIGEEYMVALDGTKIYGLEKP